MKIENYIEKNDYLNTKKALKEISDINSIEVQVEDNNGEFDYESLLSYAIKCEADSDIVVLLIDSGASLEYSDIYGIGIFDLAVEKNTLWLVKYLIEKKSFNPNITKRRSGFLPLMSAVSYSYKEMTKYLISKGAVIDKQDTNSLSAIDYARKLGLKSMQEILKEALK